MEQDRDDRDIDSNNNMAEKVIKDLSLILKELNSIEDFTIIPTSTNSFDRNVSPVQYIDVEHCLGLESWCVKHVFKYSQMQILKLRKSVLKRSSTEDVDKLNMYLNAALLILAEVNTFWNIKRELHTFLDPEQEMQFTKLVLSHKPKSLQAYTYRAWLIKQQQHSTILEQELITNKKSVAASPNNYHAWNHRIWCMENVLPKGSNYFNDIIMDEFHYSKEFINQHVSEHSGFHYRQYVLQQFKSIACNPTEKLMQFFNTLCFVDEEYCKVDIIKSFVKVDPYLNILLYELFDVCKQLNLYYPGHEAVWYHRRFIFYEIISFLCRICGFKTISEHCFHSKTCLSLENCNKQSNSMRELKLYKSLLVYEQHFLGYLSKHNVNDLWDHGYLEKHQRWLKSSVNIDLNVNVVLSNGDMLFRKYDL